MMASQDSKVWLNGDLGKSSFVGNLLKNVTTSRLVCFVSNREIAQGLGASDPIQILVLHNFQTTTYVAWQVPGIAATEQATAGQVSYSMSFVSLEYCSSIFFMFWGHIQLCSSGLTLKGLYVVLGINLSQLYAQKVPYSLYGISS